MVQFDQKPIRLAAVADAANLWDFPYRVGVSIWLNGISTIKQLWSIDFAAGVQGDGDFRGRNLYEIHPFYRPDCGLSDGS